MVNVARRKIKYIFLLDSFCYPFLLLFSTLNWLCISRKSLSHAKHFHVAELQLNHCFPIVPFTPAHKRCHFSTRTLRCQPPSPGEPGWQSRYSIFKEQHNFYLKNILFYWLIIVLLNSVTVQTQTHFNSLKTDKNIKQNIKITAAWLQRSTYLFNNKIRNNHLPPLHFCLHM